VLLGPAQFDALDDEIRSVLPPEKLITPDDARHFRCWRTPSSTANRRWRGARQGMFCSTTAGTTARTTSPGIRRRWPHLHER
jgi:hypothetical protein